MDDDLAYVQKKLFAAIKVPVMSKKAAIDDSLKDMLTAMEHVGKAFAKMAPDTDGDEIATSKKVKKASTTKKTPTKKVAKPKAVKPTKISPLKDVLDSVPAAPVADSSATTTTVGVDPPIIWHTTSGTTAATTADWFTTSGTTGTSVFTASYLVPIGGDTVVKIPSIKLSSGEPLAMDLSMPSEETVPEAPSPLPKPTTDPCGYCHGTNRVVWDPFKFGPPPPPKNWDSYKSWVWDFDNVQCMDCPKCTDRGWGRAANLPWAQAYHEAEKSFSEAIKYVCDWYEKRAQEEYQQVSRLRVAAERSCYIARLVRLAVRAQQAPEWPKDPDFGKEVCPNCNAYNFTPTYHPRTHEAAVACCECPTARIVGDVWKPTESQLVSLRYSLAELGFSARTIDDLTERFHYHDLLPVSYSRGTSERMPDLR